MRLTTRLGTTIPAVVLAAGGMSIAGVATSAHAAPSIRHCGYPPGQCQIYFSHSSYLPGSDVSFYSDRAFRVHEWVHGTLNCPGDGGDKSVGPWQANGNHRVSGTFHLKKRTPAGTCTLTLVGPNTGNHASGTFNVRHRH
jgi:hypothetical protein